MSSNLGSSLNYGRYLQNHLVYPVESIRISFGELAALSMLPHREPELRGPVQHNGGGVLRRRPHDNHLRWGVAVRQVYLLWLSLPQRRELEKKQRKEKNNHRHDRCRSVWEELTCACVLVAPRVAAMSVKRSVSSREVAGPTRLKATESFTIDVSMYAHT